MSPFIKRFDEWIERKIRLNNNDHNPPFFKEKEIWWCSIGENVGIEISGKGTYFRRPVLVLKRINRLSFICIPLTKTNINGELYRQVKILENTNTLLAVQIHFYDYRRLDKYIATLSETEFQTVKKLIAEFIIK